jgi:hypothetical protein
MIIQYIIIIIIISLWLPTLSQHSQYIFATTAPNTTAFDQKELWVSTDEGNSFKRALFPLDDASKPSHFHIVDASEGVVFLAMEHKVTAIKGNSSSLKPQALRARGNLCPKQIPPPSE